MDYSKLSDSEINAAVECEMDESFRFMEFDEETDEFIYCDQTGENCQRIKPKDYCNNPSDAWPIIVENKISILEDDGEWEASIDYPCDIGAYGTTEICSKIYEDKNPLRATMIVYLMMHEVK